MMDQEVWVRLLAAIVVFFAFHAFLIWSMS